jgi:transposase-like protein
MSPSSLAQAVREFADPAKCRTLLIPLRFAGGKVLCPECGGEQHGRIETRNLFVCRACHKQFSLTSGTILDRCRVPAGYWLAACWCVAEEKVPSQSLADVLGVTNRTAWRMMHLIRVATKTRSFGAAAEAVNGNLSPTTRLMACVLRTDPREAARRLRAERKRRAEKKRK